MPVTTDADLLIKAFKIQEVGSTVGVWLYYDTTKELLRTSRVNSNLGYLGDFLKSPMTPSEIFVRQTYPSLGFALDFILGSKTTVSSQRRGLLPTTITANNIFVYYKPPQLTDIFTFTIYSTDDSLNKTIVMPITISPVDVVPTNIQGNPTINTLNNKYTGLTMLFSEGGVDAGVVTTSSSQSSVSNVSFSNGTCTFDYTTPTTDTSDSIIFTSCKAADIQYVNASAHTFEIKNLLKEPDFSNWLVTPASQNFPYTNSDSLVAVFNKDIKTCTSITATNGSPLTIVPISIIGKQITFEWTSLNTGSVNFIFNGLESMDGSIDANVNGLIEVGPIILNTPPIIVGWSGSQPTEENTLYNLSVLFNKQLSNSRTPIITATDGITPVFTSISGSQVNFTVTTSSNPSTTVYTLKNIAALDGSIKSENVNISAGAKIISVQVETDLSGSYLEMSSLVIERPQKVKIILSKPISGVLSFVPNDNCAFGVVTMINDFTAQLTITPVNNGNTSLVIQTNNIITVDGSQSVLSRTFSLVYSQTIVNLYEFSSKNVVKTTFDIGTSVYLSLQVSKPISSDLSETTITCSKGTISNVSTSTILNKYYYNFNFTPTAESNNETITINQAKDLNNFKYTLFKSNLIFEIPYAYPSAFTTVGWLHQLTPRPLTLLFSGGDGFHSNFVSEQVAYVKYVQGTSEIIFTDSNLSCSKSANTISISSITPFLLENLIIKVALRAPNGSDGPELTFTILANAIAPQWVPTSAGVITSNISAPHKLVVESTAQLTFSFNSVAGFPNTDATSLFLLRINNTLTSLVGALVDMSLLTVRIPYTANSVETTTFEFSTQYGSTYTFVIASSEVYTFPTMNTTTRSVNVATLEQTITLTSTFSATFPASVTADVNIIPTGYTVLTPPATISGTNVTYSLKIDHDVVHTGSVTLTYGPIQRSYLWSTGTLTNAHIYTFPSSFTYNGTSNGFGTNIHLKESTSGSLTLTFTGGDMIHSNFISTQVAYVKFVQNSNETTIISSLLTCSDTLETITITSLTPSSTSDLTLKVKLLGPDNVSGPEMSVVIPSSQITASVQTVSSIYNINPRTRIKTSGLSPDSNSGSLILALPLDSQTELSSQINTSTNTKTITWRSGYVTTSTSRYYGSSYTIRTPSTGWPTSPMTSFLVGGFTSPLEAYFNNNFTLEMWIRPTIPNNPPNTGNTLLQTGVYPQSNQITMYCNIDNSYSASNLGRIAVYNRSTAVFYYGTRVLTVNNWHHLAFVRSGSTFVVYINGVSSMSFPAWTMQSMTTFCVGGINLSDYFYEDFYGNVQDLRMYSVAKYTGPFTVPSITYTNVTTIASFVDASTGLAPVLVGLQTTQCKVTVSGGSYDMNIASDFTVFLVTTGSSLATIQAVTSPFDGVVNDYNQTTGVLTFSLTPRTTGSVILVVRVLSGSGSGALAATLTLAVASPVTQTNVSFALASYRSSMFTADAKGRLTPSPDGTYYNGLGVLRNCGTEWYPPTYFLRPSPAWILTDESYGTAAIVGTVVNKVFTGDFTVVLSFAHSYISFGMGWKANPDIRDFEHHPTYSNNSWMAMWSSPWGFVGIGGSGGGYGNIGAYNVETGWFNPNAAGPFPVRWYRYVRSGNNVSIAVSASSATGPWTVHASGTISNPTDKVLCMIGQAAGLRGCSDPARIISVVN
jgi:hypothetical protein